MSNKFVCYCNKKPHPSGFYKLLENIFCLLLVVETSSLQEAIEMLEEVVVSWQEVRWIWWMRQNFVIQFIQLLKHFVQQVVGHFHGEELGPFCWQMPAAVAVFGESHQFNFAWIQKVAMDQTSSRPPNSNHDNPGFCFCFFFFGLRLSLGSTLELLLHPSQKRSGLCWLSYKILFFFFFCHESQSNWEMDCCCIE